MNARVTLSCESPGLAVIRLAAISPSAELAAELAGICEAINFDTSIKAAIITGSGLAFCRDVAFKRKIPLSFSLSGPVASLNCPWSQPSTGMPPDGLELALACDIRRPPGRHFSFRHRHGGYHPMAHHSGCHAGGR
jgi:hypothetical protein